MTFRPARRDAAVALAGLLAGAAVAAAIAVAAWPTSASSGSSSSSNSSGAAKAGARSGASASGTASATLAPDPVNETLRPNEIVLPAEGPFTSGKIVLVPLRMECGMSTIVGTHGEMEADGQFCFVRVALTANDTFTHTFDVHKTALTTTGGASVQVSYSAQEVERQPLEIAPVGSHDRYEFDIYYDVPKDAAVNGFTFSDGEGGPTTRVPLPVRAWPAS